MGNVMTQIDKANGYIYGKAEDDAMRQLYSSGAGFEWEKIATVREKYVYWSFLLCAKPKIENTIPNECINFFVIFM